MDNNNESKKANRKAMPKFMLIMIISLFVGGCTILAIALAVCALIFGIGFLPSLIVCLIWIVNLSVYCKEALRYSKVGNIIS